MIYTGFNKVVCILSKDIQEKVRVGNPYREKLNSQVITWDRYEQLKEEGKVFARLQTEASTSPDIMNYPDIPAKLIDLCKDHLLEELLLLEEKWIKENIKDEYNTIYILKKPTGIIDDDHIYFLEEIGLGKEA